MTYDSSLSNQTEKAAYIKIFNTIVGHNLLLEADPPYFTILAATQDRLRDVGMTQEEVIGKPLFEAHPGNTTDPTDNGVSNLRASLDYVLRHKEAHQLPIQRYDLPDGKGGFAEKYWNASNRPVLNNDGDVAYIVHTAENITAQVKAAQKELQMEDLQKVFSLVMHAPMVVGLANGDNYVLEMANEAAFKLWGKGPEEIIGKPILEGLPELKDQGIIELFDRVRSTGKPYIANEVPVTSMVNGKKEQHYFNLVYQPYYSSDGEKVTGVFTISHDVTAQVMARQKVVDSEAKYQALFKSMDQGFCLIEVLFDKAGHPVDYRFLEVNPMFEKQTGLIEPAGKNAKELVPGLEPHWFQLYGEVVRTGKSVRFTEGSDAMGRWFEVNAFRAGGEGSNKVAILFTDVSQRRGIEEGLRKSESYFRQLTDTVPAIIWITRPDGYCTYLNKNWYDYTGQTEEEAEGFGWLNATHPDDAEEAGRLFLEAIQKQGPYYILYRLRHTSGEYRWAIDSGQPKFSADGTFEGMMGTVIDVHEQKLAEDKIRESEERFRSMADASPVMIWTLDEAGNSTYYNKRARAFTGHTDADLESGKSWQVAIHPDDIAYAGSVVGNAVAARIPYAMECRMQNVHGEWRWLYNQGIPRFGKEGEYFGYVGSSVDITDQKKIQQELQTALEQIRLSKEAAELGTFDMDLERGTMHWDDRCRALFGISHKNAVSFDEDFIERLHPDDKDRVAEAMQKVFVKSLTNGDYDVEYRTIGAEDSAVRWVRAKGKVYFAADDKPVRFIGSVLDITQQVDARQRVESLVTQRTKELATANENLSALNKELQRSNQNLEEFAHAASHDLKEPVRKIHFFTHQLREQLKEHLQEPEIRSFSRIENATMRMGILIDDLLLYSHVSHRPHETETIDLGEKVKRVLEDLELNIEEKKAKITVGKLPVIQGYRRQLQQLFQNLISNALKYSEADTPPQIHITSEEVEREGKTYHLIAVRDNGIGFDPVYAEKIFQMFARLHGKAEYSGTGVGLSIVKKVVENHHGFIEAESEVGKGSLFKVYLPG